MAPSTSIFVDNLPPEWSSSDLRKHFMPFCTVVDAYVASKLSKRNSRFGFIRVPLSENATSVSFSANGCLVENKRLFVSLAKFDRRGPKAPAKTPPATATENPRLVGSRSYVAALGIPSPLSESFGRMHKLPEEPLDDWLLRRAKTALLEVGRPWTPEVLRAWVDLLKPLFVDLWSSFLLAVIGGQALPSAGPCPHVAGAPASVDVGEDLGEGQTPLPSNSADLVPSSTFRAEKVPSEDVIEGEMVLPDGPQQLDRVEDIIQENITVDTAYAPEEVVSNMGGSCSEVLGNLAPVAVVDAPVAISVDVVVGAHTAKMQESDVEKGVVDALACVLEEDVSEAVSNAVVGIDQSAPEAGALAVSLETETQASAKSRGKGKCVVPTRFSSRSRKPTLKAFALTQRPGHKIKVASPTRALEKPSPEPPDVNDARLEEQAVEAWDLAQRLGCFWEGDPSEIIQQFKEAARGSF